jgi:cysteine sulfinate desulfinase/cysteine desulfurase-like protein
LIASPTDSSSSTHAMNGVSGIGVFISVDRKVSLRRCGPQFTQRRGGSVQRSWAH